jgi:hypothetical protein
VSLSKSISIFHASLGENGLADRQARCYEAAAGCGHGTPALHVHSAPEWFI